MAAINQDSRNAATMTADNRSAVGTLTQDQRSFKYLWAITTFPWQEALPWQINGNASQLTQNARH